MKKILLITNIPTPYRIPLFNELSKQLSDRSISFKVIFGGLGYPRRKWKINLSEFEFPYHVLNSNNINKYFLDYGLFLYIGIINILLKESPDVVITNGFSLSTMQVYFLNYFKKIKYIIWSGAIERHSYKDASIKMLFRKMLVKKASSFISYGTKSKLYLERLGADASDIFIGINTVDTSYYDLSSYADYFKVQDKTKHHILYVGHVTAGKRLDNVLYSIKYLSKTRNDFVVDVAGDGPELEKIVRLSDSLNIRNYFNFHGFMQKEEVLRYLSMSKCFVFPSEYDIWGLVLVEAMSAGIPCISSVYAGATCDLIQDGVTGFAMDFSDHAKIAEKIDWILNNPVSAREIGENAESFIKENVNLKTSANGFLMAINKSINKDM